MAFWVAVAVTIVLVVAQDRTLLGKYTAATGGNATAARLSGHQHPQGGLHRSTCSWARPPPSPGVARSSFMSLGDPLSGDGMELSAILVVLLGGTAFSGGEGRVLRSFIGVAHHHGTDGGDAHPRASLLPDAGHRSRAARCRRIEPPRQSKGSRRVSTSQADWESVRLMARVLTLYYEEGRNQSQVASALGLSAAKVNRLIKQAKEEGLVEIKIHTPFQSVIDLEDRLRSRFGVKDAVIVPKLSEDPASELAAIGRAGSSTAAPRASRR